jgi:8-oxo-dGTP diphosphatase
MERVVQVASGVLFTPDRARMLIVHNVGGTWSPPGGGVEPGEYLEAALHREMYEETGLEVRIERLLAVSEGFSTRKPDKLLFFNFLLTLVDPSAVPTIVRPDEIDAHEWVDPVELRAKMPWLPFDPWQIAAEPYVRLHKSVVL